MLKTWRVEIAPRSSALDADVICKVYEDGVEKAIIEMSRAEFDEMVKANKILWQKLIDIAARRKVES